MRFKSQFQTTVFKIEIAGLFIHRYFERRHPFRNMKFQNPGSSGLDGYVVEAGQFVRGGKQFDLS